MDQDAEKLASFRTVLDAVDAQLVELLGRRYGVCREVAHFKKTHGIAMMQSGRVEAVKKRCAELGSAHGVDPAFVRKLYDLIIAEACRLEDEIMAQPSAKT